MALIKLRNVDLIVLKTNLCLIENINFEIEKGKKILVAGINGAGKSTLFKALLDYKGIDEERYAKLTNGQIIFDESLDRENLNKNIINIMQEDYLSLPFKKVENVLKDVISQDIKDKNKYFKNWIERYKPLIEDDIRKNLLKKRIYSLSGGEKKFVALLKGLVRCDDPNVKLALIDEPINNLDAKHIIQFSDLLSRIQYFNQDLSFVIITHCHAFPVIDVAYEVSNGKFNIVNYENHKCHNCFGKTNEGYYQNFMNPNPLNKN